MKPSRIGSVALALAALIALARPVRADPAVHATADPATVGSDDNFQVTVRADGARDVELAAMPETRDFEVVGRSRATEVSIRNDGAPQTSERLILTVHPLRTGKLTFPAVTVQADGKTATTAPLAIDVVPGHVAGPARASNDPFAGLGFGSADPFGDDDDLADMMRRMQSSMFSPRPSKNDVLVRASVDNPHPYVGEQTTLSLHLLTRLPLSSVQLTRFPSVAGATADDLATPKEPTPQIVEVGGVRYQSVLLARKALFAMRPGAVDVPPIEVAADTGGFGGGYRVTASTPPLRFSARALPGGGPADAPVGRWTLSAAAPPRAVAGEPLTVRVAAEGSGDLHALSLPAPVPPHGWRAYAPSTHDTPAVNGTRLGGTRTTETVLVPDLPGRFVIEVPPLAYFDTVRHRYAEAATPPLVIEVAPAAAVSAPAAPSVTPPIAAHTAPARPRSQPFAIVLAVVAPLAFLGLIAAARRRRARRPVSPRAHLRRARRHLQLAAALRARGRATQVYDELARAVQHAVAAVAPRDATSPARLDQHLAAAGVAPPTAAALVAAANAIHAGRFAPASDDGQLACTLTAAALSAAGRTPVRRPAARSSIA